MLCISFWYQKLKFWDQKSFPGYVRDIFRWIRDNSFHHSILFSPSHWACLVLRHIGTQLADIYKILLTYLQVLLAITINSMSWAYWAHCNIEMLCCSNVYVVRSVEDLQLLWLLQSCWLMMFYKYLFLYVCVCIH